MNIKFLRRPRWAGTAVSLAVMCMAMPSSGAGASQPTLTEAQIESDVAASSGIQVANPAVLSELATARLDFNWLPMAGSQTCNTATQCVAGDMRSKKVIVLLGDSHTNMWLPASLQQQPLQR